MFEFSPTLEILELVYPALLNDDERVDKVCAMLLRAWEERSPATRAVSGPAALPPLGPHLGSSEVA